MSALKLITSTITGLFKPMADLVDNVHTSTEEKLQLKNKLFELQSALITAVLNFLEEQIKAQKEIILAEIKGSWLTANWRPMLMVMFMFMIFNNYILVPYLNAAFKWSVTVGIPANAWDLLKYGVGGYVGGRSVEKIVKTVKGKM